MKINMTIDYSIDDVLKDIGYLEKTQANNGIISMNIEDKFFIGFGCEMLTSDKDISMNKNKSIDSIPQNVSVCVCSPNI